MYPSSGFSEFPNTIAAKVPQVNVLLAPSEQNEFSNFWSTSTLGKAVLLGRKLTNEKPRYYLPQRQCDVINIDYITPSCDHRNRIKCSRRQIRNTYSAEFCPTYLRSSLPTLSRKQHIKHFCLPKISQKKGKPFRSCPLRIAELAVSSKRRCLDTWRSKYSILPDYMVERLKQQVLDQRPIVQISDAINCFKKRRSRPKRICKKRKTIKCVCEYSKTETKVLCAMFGHKIAFYLNKPLSVSLTPRLQRISNIVADEIVSLVRKKINLYKTVNQKILYEIAGKVSIWMEMILEESTYKLQEDELNDLEEEIGPVLDFIDDLIANTLNNCAPDTVPTSFDEDSKESSLNEEFEKKTISEISFSEEAFNLEELQAIEEDYDPVETEGKQSTNKYEITEDEEISISNFFTNEIVDIILNIVNEDIGFNVIEEEVADDKTVDSTQIQVSNTDRYQFSNNLELQPETENSLPNPEYANYFEKHNNTLTENIVHDIIHIDLLDNATEEQSKTKDDSAISNVSEKSQIFSEEPDDDNNKKVKFSSINMGSRDKLKNNSETQVFDARHDFEKEQASWKVSANNIKSNIIFAPPNENLLSDADESWPNNIPSTVLRPSESKSRSITSLGRILETDEKIPISPKSDDVAKTSIEEVAQEKNRASFKSGRLKPMYENKEKTYIKQKKTLVQKEKSAEIYQPKKRNLSLDSKKSSGTPKLYPPKTNDTLERIKHYAKVKNKKNLEKYRRYNSNFEKIHLSKTDKIILNTNIGKDKQKKSVTKKQPIFSHEDGPLDRSKSANKTFGHQQPHLRPDYRVNEATAPTWLKRKRADMNNVQTFGINQNEIRQWCIYLDREFGRFETWNNWLKCTCQNFVAMQQWQASTRRVTCCDFKQWTKFKRNLNKNVCTWGKLKRRTQNRLNETIYICLRTSENETPKQHPRRCIGRNVKNTQSSPHCSTYKKYY